MRKILDQMRTSVKEVRERTTEAISDVLEHEGTQATIDWARRSASAATDEAVRLGKQVVRSDMAKDAATGAAIGAVIATPLPVISPIAGAVLGVGMGLYRNFSKPEGRRIEIAPPEHKGQKSDIYDQLLKLDDLRQKGIITDAEFEGKKRGLLRSE